MTNKYLLLKEKITQLTNEPNKISIPPPYIAYFKRTATFLATVIEQYEFVKSGEIYKAGIDELAKRNKTLFTDILPENYEKSYANPTYAVKSCGNEIGKLFSFLYIELRSLIAYAHEKRLDSMLIRLELFTKIYEAFATATQDSKNNTPSYDELYAIISDFIFKNIETVTEEEINQKTTKNEFAKRIINRSFGTLGDSDLNDLRYLYYFGEYITENELAIARHLNSLPEERIKLMADTFTEGYRMGFTVTGKDISKKGIAEIRYELGFERMIRKAVENFTAIGLKSVFIRTGLSVIEGRSVNRRGYFGAYANKQYEFDHKDDRALFYNPKFSEARLKALEKAYQNIENEAKLYAGPAVVMGFGELPPTPIYKDEAYKLSEEQQKIQLQYMTKADKIINRYIPREEYSYTIIAFPTPGIGTRFTEIFDETITLNTLDYVLYRDIQQTIIDCLDQAEYVKVTGRGENKTNLVITLQELSDPAKQTNFENCVADVNIPVGEIFTSPKLKGTNGILHVTRVFLDGLEYKDLTLTVKDGMVTDYTCANFASPVENKKFIKENILFHHDSLPIGEFAIGTNTTAYMVGKKYDIADRFPILIAEKTGPHFAFGDTCYAHAEEIKVFNPDGKEIVARDNEISIKRKNDADKAYFHCHTDITIPYDELGEIIVKHKSGDEIAIFSDAKFALEGCEELNNALCVAITN